MSTYESDRDAAAKNEAEVCYCAGPTCSGCEKNTIKIFTRGADWGYERGANAELKEWRESMRKHHFDEISQKLEAARAELQNCGDEMEIKGVGFFDEQY